MQPLRPIPRFIYMLGKLTKQTREKEKYCIKVDENLRNKNKVTLQVNIN